MAVNISTLHIKIGADTFQADIAFKKLGQGVQALDRNISRAGSGIRGFGASLKQFAGQALALAGIGGALGSLAIGAKLTADAEQAQVAFKVMLGGAAQANAMLEELKQFALRTPFDLPGVRQGARTLLAFGIEANQLMPIMQMLGDVSAGTGKDFTELATIFGQIKSAGRLMGQDLLQLTTAGVPIIGALQKQFGATGIEIRKMVEAGTISFDDVVTAFKSMTNEGGIFFNMMDEQSKTLAGRWSKLKESAQVLAVEVGERLLPAMKGIVDTTTVVIDAVSGFDMATVRSTATTAALVGGFLMAVNVIPKLIAAFRAVTIAIRMFTTAQVIATAFSGPKGWAILAASAVVAAGAAAAVGYAFSSLEKETVAVAEVNTKVIDTNDNLAASMRKAKEAADAQAKAMEELQKRGHQFASSLATPFEQGIEYLTEARNLFDSGVISFDILNRAIEKTVLDMDEAMDTKKDLDSVLNRNVGAVTRNTIAGFSAVVEARNNQAKLERDAAITAAATSETAARLMAIEAELRRRGITTFRGVGL